MAVILYVETGRDTIHPRKPTAVALLLRERGTDGSGNTLTLFALLEESRGLSGLGVDP